ncbi:hypothetical protein GpartN1_g684.t1 [Galdieria partita]|uniref:Uncharacterized protein n=1 Tax=Galdieria partita TaxID=83374 RepID=A0A9C7PQQ5_9RHOD|nr:hypothetical protein GpartN1_g684.t1 [Galdieria partita]
MSLTFVTFGSYYFRFIPESTRQVCKRCTTLVPLSKRTRPITQFQSPFQTSCCRGSEKREPEEEDSSQDGENSEKPKLDWDILKKRMKEVSSGQNKGQFPPDAIPMAGRPPANIWVLIFNPSTNNQGIYSLKISGVDVVLAFQEQDEAKIYAALLEAQDFPKPVPELIKFEEVADFCKNSGLRLGFVPKGALLSPPQSDSAEVEKWRRIEERGATSPEEERRQISDDKLEEMKKKLEDLFDQGP